MEPDEEHVLPAVTETGHGEGHGTFPPQAVSEETHARDSAPGEGLGDGDAVLAIIHAALGGEVTCWHCVLEGHTLLDSIHVFGVVVLAE